MIQIHQILDLFSGLSLLHLLAIPIFHLSEEDPKSIENLK